MNSANSEVSITPTLSAWQPQQLHGQTLLYQVDGYCTKQQSKIVAVADNRIRVDQNIFYPQGGGQPGDQGSIFAGDTEIASVIDTSFGIEGVWLQLNATTAELQVGTSITCQLDWQRRYKFMQLHTGLHLLCAILPFPVTGCGISNEKAHLDLDCSIEGVSMPAKEEITERLAGLIAEQHPVGYFRVDRDKLAADSRLVRTVRQLPVRLGNILRLVKIGNVDEQICGGTHVANTREIAPIRVSKVVSKGKQNRRVTITFHTEELN